MNIATTTPTYPIPRPASGDDARFCLGSPSTSRRSLHHYGYPPVLAGPDLVRLQRSLFTLICQEKTP